MGRRGSFTPKPTTRTCDGINLISQFDPFDFNNVTGANSYPQPLPS
jgi:hypothetical protein